MHLVGMAALFPGRADGSSDVIVRPSRLHRVYRTFPARTLSLCKDRRMFRCGTRCSAQPQKRLDSRKVKPNAGMSWYPYPSNLQHCC